MPITTQNYVYPTSAEMQEISQDLLPRLQGDRPIFDILPIETKDAFDLIWEQMDNFTGLQQWRGLNGSPSRVSQTGAKQYKTSPGVYGEYMVIDEEELTRRRSYGDPLQPAKIVDLVTERLTKLLQRRLDRIETIGWNLLQGSYSVAGANGAVMITDTYNVQTYSTVTPWSTRASASPFGDFAAAELLHRGHSVSFGADATAYMNLKTWNNFLLNYNTNDVAGRRIPGLVTINSVSQANQLLQGDGLPQIKVYDEGYLTDAGVFTPFIPDGTVILVGKRPAGQKVGAYRMVRNAVNPNAAPGAYSRVLVPQDSITPQIQVHDGHNGGPVLYFPSAIVNMNVAHSGS